MRPSLQHRGDISARPATEIRDLSNLAQIEILRDPYCVATRAYQAIHRANEARRIVGSNLKHIGSARGLAGGDGILQSPPHIPERAIEENHAAEILIGIAQEITPCGIGEDKTFLVFVEQAQCGEGIANETGCPSISPDRARERCRIERASR